MIVLVFSVFILYTLACVCDGPDVKPRLKRYVGKRLESMANSLVSINYCKGANCSYVNVVPQPTRTIVRPVRIGERVLISEGALYEAMYSDMFAQQHNLLSPCAKDRLISEAKEMCLRSMMNRLKRKITFSVHEDEDRRGIYVIGTLDIDERSEVDEN